VIKKIKNWTMIRVARRRTSPFRTRRGYVKDDFKVVLSPWAADTKRSGPWGWFSYGLNLYENLGRQDGTIREVDWSSIEETSNYPIFFESIFPQQSDLPSKIRGSFRIPNRDASPAGGVWMPHGLTTNVAFLDGSVSTIGPERLKELGLRSAFDENGERIDFD